MFFFIQQKMASITLDRCIKQSEHFFSIYVINGKLNVDLHHYYVILDRTECYSNSDNC